MSTICVSLGIDDPAKLVAEHRRLVAAGCKLVEYRLDFLPPGVDVATLVKSRPGPIVATVRRPEDGGKWTGPEAERRKMLAAAIDAGAEYVDLEPDAARAIPRRGATKRIVSRHDFRETPRELEKIHAELAACDADTVKLAVTAVAPVDNFRVLQLVRDAKLPTVGLCMGELGAASRILNAVCGSPFSFAAKDEASAVAPGQLSFTVMRDLYRYETLSKESLMAAVIGDPIGHSKSPLIHNRALAVAGIDGVYVAFRVPPETLDEFVVAAQKFGLRGLSVTIPHKEAVQKHVTRLDPAAAKIGAVNTLTFESNGVVGGCNTDEAGALDSLEAIAPVRGKQALVLGAGGAAKGIAYGLVRRGARVTVTNRSWERAEELAAALGCRAVSWEDRATVEYDVLVNCTSLGMHPKPDESPLPASALRRGTIVFDTVYNPLETKLLREAKAAGATIVYGTEMFVRQAEHQFRLFFGAEPSLDVMRSALQMGNGEWGMGNVGSGASSASFPIPHSAFSLVLIGFRGTGKTTTSRLLAARLGWSFVDADDEIERRAGKTIAQIFADDGEPVFRDHESAVLAELLQRERNVVACGGGVVIRPENRALLKPCPRVVWLTAKPETSFARISQDATTAGRRPSLTQTADGLAEAIALVARREPWYRECAKLVVATDERTPEQAADEIVAAFGLSNS